MNIRILRRLSLPALAAGCLIAHATTVCRADLIPLTFSPGGPTVTSINGNLSYDASTGHFRSTSTALTLNASLLTGGFSLFTPPGTVSVDLFVDKNGKFVSNGAGLMILGTVKVNGTTVSGTTAADPLLTGVINNFGADLAGPPSRSFDGLFTVTGGELAKPISTPGGNVKLFDASVPGGFILDAENVTAGILGNFSQSFSSTTGKVTTGSTVPEPGVLTLGLVAASGFAAGACLRGLGRSQRSR